MFMSACQPASRARAPILRTKGVPGRGGVEHKVGVVVVVTAAAHAPAQGGGGGGGGEEGVGVKAAAVRVR